MSAALSRDDRIRESMQAIIDRRKPQLSRKGWSRLAGRSERLLSHFLNGRVQSLTADTLDAFAKAVHLPLAVLMGDEPDPLDRNPPPPAPKPDGLPSDPLERALAEIAELQRKQMEILTWLMAERRAKRHRRDGSAPRGSGGGPEGPA